MNMTRMIALILRAVALAMGLCTFILALLKDITIGSAVTMLSLGLSCLAVASLQQFNK